MPYGIILLPGKADADKFSEFSGRLGMNANASMLLGENAPAHLSLLHIDCTQAAAELCWNLFSGQSPASVPVELVYLAFKPRQPGDYYVPEGGISASLEAVCTELLMHLRERAVDAAKEVGAVILGGRDFQPHMSLAVLRGTRIGEFDLSPTVVPSSFAGRIALGRLGAYGTFPEILAQK